jgi:hypothetical protein
LSLSVINFVGAFIVVLQCGTACFSVALRVLRHC